MYYIQKVPFLHENRSRTVTIIYGVVTDDYYGLPLEFVTEKDAIKHIKKIHNKKCFIPIEGNMENNEYNYLNEADFIEKANSIWNNVPLKSEQIMKAMQFKTIKCSVTQIAEKLNEIYAKGWALTTIQPIMYNHHSDDCVVLLSRESDSCPTCGHNQC